ERREIEAFEDAQDLLHGHAARRRRPRPADAPLAIRAAERLHRMRDVALEVLTGQAPGSERVLADLADDRVRERAGVHRVRALFRDQPERLRVLGVHEPETGRMRLPVPIVVMRAERVARLEALELVE